MPDYNDMPSWGDPEDDEQGQQLDPLQTAKVKFPWAQGPVDRSPMSEDPRAAVAPRKASQTAQMGPPPQMPNPSLWRRIAAAGVGAAAGAVNTRAGYPGGVKKPIDPSNAEDGLLGVGAYQRNLQNWQNKLKWSEYQDTLDEKAHEADVRDAEAQSRILLNQSSLDVNKAYREQIGAARTQDAQTRAEAGQAKWTQGKTISLPQFENLNPIQNLGAQPEDLPGADASATPDRDAGQTPNEMQGMPSSIGLRTPTFMGAANLQVPPTPLTQNGYQKVPMPSWALQKYGQGAEAYEALPQEQQAQNMQAKDVDVPDWLQSRLGPKAPLSELNRAISTFGKPPAPPKVKEDPNDWIATMNDPNALPEEKAAATAKHAQWLKDQSGLRSVNQFNIPPTTLTPGQANAQTMPQGEERKQAVLSGITDPMMKVKVQALWDGTAQIAPSMLVPRRGQDPSWAKANDYAMLGDPTFDQATFGVRRKMQMDYTPGGVVGRNLVSLNTLSQHMDELFGAMQQLQNGDTSSLNWFRNNMNMQFGAAEYSNAKLAQTAVNAELATALKGNATDTEIKQWASGITPNMSPAAQAGARQKLAEIMYKRMDAQLTPYVSTMHKMPTTLPTQATIQFLQSAGLDTSKLGQGGGGFGQPRAAGAPGGPGGGGRDWGSDPKQAPVGQIKAGDRWLGHTFVGSANDKGSLSNPDNWKE